ncbi:MAG: DUF4276 family protein [Verrucomicrobia bacterium]|nr:DUF4276 family protein [Verrucomicrobiota bacterium]MCF7707714.1 DUF4276 family protein [Verrucomicrobiota bacterium]
MHFEILVEDQSGRKALEILVPKIIGDSHTFKVHPYKGVGRIPKDMHVTRNANHRILLENLPKLLKGYGRTFAGYAEDYPTAVFLVCDLDNKCLHTFRQELLNILNACQPSPTTRFCIAIEEGEAWFLGDREALGKAYPNAKQDVLDGYEQDSICGTWELLADAVYSGGSNRLISQGRQAVGKEKSKWAKNISPQMDTNSNQSPSFIYFRKKLLELARAEA